MWRWSPLSKRQEFTILSYPNGLIFHVSCHCFNLGLLHSYILSCLCLLQHSIAAKRAEAWKQLHTLQLSARQWCRPSTKFLITTSQGIGKFHHRSPIHCHISTVTSAMETLFLLWLHLNNSGHGHSPLLSFPAPQMWLTGTPHSRVQCTQQQRRE